MKCNNCNEDMVKTSVLDEDTESIIEIYKCFHCGNEEETE